LFVCLFLSVYVLFVCLSVCLFVYKGLIFGLFDLIDKVAEEKTNCFTYPMSRRKDVLFIHLICLFAWLFNHGDDDDDEYKPVWPSGLWATSQGGETSKAHHRTEGRLA
jgi:hypothetical protein